MKIGDLVVIFLTTSYLALVYIYLRWIPLSALSTFLPVLWGVVWVLSGRRRRRDRLGRLDRLEKSIITLALLPVLDFTWRPYFMPRDALAFVRVGHVDHTSARLSLRRPAPGSEPWRRLELTSKAGERTIRQLDGLWESADDGVITVRVQELSPDTWYTIRLDQGDLQSTFRTWPDPRLDKGMRFSFATSSCIKPNFPYNPFRDPLTIPGMDVFAKEELAASDESGLLPRFLLFLGDFIYADVPIYFGERLYKQLYRQIYASPSYQRIYSRIPTLHIYDDHEVLNNWASNSTPPFPAAFAAYQAYNGNANPIKSFEESWYTFELGSAAAFFVMDTRRYRDTEDTQDGPGKTMLGQKQLDDLLNWMTKVNQSSVFKFIVSSVPYTDLWRGFDGHLDTWAGYTYERQILNNVIRTMPNVILLSGDRHEFAATMIGTPKQHSPDGQPGIGDTEMIEFSTSPMSQFYLPIRTYIEELGAPHSKLGSGDLPMKYVQTGNVKYTMFDIDTRDPEHMTATAILKVDGKEAWRHEIVAKPLSPSSTSLGRQRYSIFDLYRLALQFFA